MIKALRIFLALIFIVLIILLLLKMCNKPRPVDDDDEEEEEELIERSRTIGQTGALKVTAMWDFYADIDLHVTEPSGFEIYYEHQDSPSGGNLDVDDRIGGRGAAENIYWERPPVGTYTVELVFYGINEDYIGRTNSGVVHVIIKKKGQRAERHDVRLSEPPDPESKTRVATIRISLEDEEEEDDDE